MLISGASHFSNALRRIGLWAVSSLLAVALFSLLFNLIVNRAASLSPIVLIFRVTVIFALPVWCLYLPLVICLKDAEGRRFWTILFSGSLIGPASLALWCFILQLRGADPDAIWHGDPLTGVGGGLGMVFALIVGFLATCLYLIALKIFHRHDRGTFTGSDPGNHQAAARG